MGSILINVSDISDNDLVFDENETRRILKFFWPHLENRIDGMSIDNDARRLAQTALVAAIDGTYAIGFIQALAETIVRPGSGIKPLAKKLGRRFVRHWWKHATQRDLENARIYDSVRKHLAAALKLRLELLLEGVALGRGVLRFYATVGNARTVWA